MSFDLEEEIERKASNLNEMGLTLLKNVVALAKNKISINFTYSKEKEILETISYIEFKTEGGTIDLTIISDISKAIQENDISLVTLIDDLNHETLNLYHLKDKVRFIKLLKKEVNECMDQIKSLVSEEALANVKEIQEKIDSLLTTYDKWGDQEKL